ncbi:MAG: FAD:protein FMN transferase [Longimicrobiales bacterium]|nr:FAD:protein FMN transferase [Longimicrobiales bacterium]
MYSRRRIMPGRPRTLGRILGPASAALLLIGSTPGYAQESAAVIRHTFESTHMGTTFRIVAYSENADVARAAAAQAFGHVARLDSLFSDYRPDSEVTRLTQQATIGRYVPVSTELWSILLEANQWSDRTSGLFDVTVGPLSRLWRWSARRAELPDPGRIRHAREAVGFQGLIVDAHEPQVKLTRAGMALDLGGIAKGFAADAILNILARHGIDAALVDAGGDIAAGAPPPRSDGWLVALPDGDSLRIAHSAVATSGDVERHVIVNGVRYAHIVDPRTGLGVIRAQTVTVGAPTATSADVLASVLSIMDAPSGHALIQRTEGAWARTYDPEQQTRPFQR